MRTLGEIVDLVKINGCVTEDELRYAIIALSALQVFDSKSLRQLYTAEEESKPKRLIHSAKWQYEQHFDRWKRALDTSPKEYVGASSDPKNKDVVDRILLSRKLVEKLTKQN